MDTSVEAVTTDALGRRTGPRRLRTNEEKRRIVEKTLKPGASVAIVARGDAAPFPGRLGDRDSLYGISTA